MLCRSIIKRTQSKMAKIENSDDSEGPIIDDNIIRIQLRKPSQRKWELRTRNLSPGVRFPTIQLFDCEGNLLVETNDENISIKSCEGNESALRTQSLREKDYRHYIDKRPLKKHKTISGGKIYTRVFRSPAMVTSNPENGRSCYIIKDCSGVVNIPNRNTLHTNFYLQTDSLNVSPTQSDGPSEVSSYKSSDDEICDDEKRETHEEKQYSEIKRFKNDFRLNDDKSALTYPECDRDTKGSQKKEESEIDSGLHKSSSFNDMTSKSVCKSFKSVTLPRSKSGACMYSQPQNKIPFLNTYLKSLPGRTFSNPDWFNVPRRNIVDNTEKPPESVKSVKSCDSPSEATWSCVIDDNDNTSDNESINIPTDIAVDCEMRNRLKMYRRGLSEVEVHGKLSVGSKRRHSFSEVSHKQTSSSSESLDEADLVLNRLKRRISRNRIREKRRSIGSKYNFGRQQKQDKVSSRSDCRDDGGTRVRSRQTMGSNISQHSIKGLKGRRARSSGDLCNGDSKSQTESSVCGSVVGDSMGWNRSLPNHLDGNRHLTDYSRVNNNYAEFATYNRCHPKGGRGLRYRASKSGSDADPVWKLQDPGFDQGYGSERSPEEDYTAPRPLPEPVSLDEYEAQLRAVYPFITQENTFSVVVEKDGRGLGMSVCGHGGLVTIRRLYPPQPAWRTGKLQQRDLLLAANGVPLAGLTTYEALEVLRTSSPRVELRVSRPPPDVLESLTPPEPPTPPARTPQPPHLPPPDPLNCHPMHVRLSQTTSSATTSSSEGRGRHYSPDINRRHDLRLHNLDQPPPVYDVLYGEFDIIMTKVNGSLGFTLRKEDHSALGHYVRALVREPALSDGRIQPGDRIVAVNDTPMSNMSHAEAVAFLRACGTDVRLRLYRDHAATPLSPMSPKDEPTDSDVPMNKPRPPLRAEAVSMLCDLAARRLTPDAADGSRSPCLSPRKFRRLTKDNNHYEVPNVPNDDRRFNANIDSYFTKPIKNVNPRRVRSVETIVLVSISPPICRKSKLSLTVPSRGYELNNLNNDQLDAPNIYQEDINHQRYTEPTYPVDSGEPVSMPAELTSDEVKFKHTNPAYQSAVLHSCCNSDATIDGQKDDNGLKKWKGVALSPDNERKVRIESPRPPLLPKPKEINPIQKENIKPDPPAQTTSKEPTIVTVELNRGWNSRLGFSVQSHPESGQSYISAVYSDSVAARDGRLQRGDVILQVNDENVTSMKTPEVIDLLRILRGSICITVLRPPQ